MTPDEYCQQRAARSGSSFYYSFRFLPEERRRAITALYAFCREVDDVVDEVSEPSVARAKLEWWRDEITKPYQDLTPAHPVVKALTGPMARYDLPLEYFQEIIDGMAMDLEYDRYPDFKSLTLYCYRVASVVGLLSARIFGYQDRRTLRYAHDLGLAFQLTNILRDVREDALRGRLYLPEDEMARFQVSFEELVEGRSSERSRALFAFQAQRAREYYQRALAQLPDCDRPAQTCGLVMAAIYSATLDEIERDGYRVLEHRVSLTPIRKLWIAWRTVRRERRRRAPCPS